jgi:hypothetical protein
MITATTLLGASGTLIASGVAHKILSHYGKEDLANTLHTLTHFGVYGYGLYLCAKVVQTAARIFLGI